MRILFTIGNPFLPQRTGGAQSSTNQLATALLKKGHEPGVVSALQGGGWTEIESRLKRRLTGSRFSRDMMNGYPVFRTWDPSDASEVVRRFRPDVAVVQNARTLPIARSLHKQGIPVVFYYRHVEFDDLQGDPTSIEGALHIANSQFTADRYRERFGVHSTVIPPLIDADLYRTETTGEHVTFINPQPLKGVEVAIELAKRCPDIPFCFLESWSLLDDYRAELNARLAALPNVTLRGRTEDMQSVYARTRIVLAPSMWEEAWGRVASEAHCSGIPVIGTNRGGLPEAIGEGGIILDHTAPMDDWVAALRRLWDDPVEHARMSEVTRRFAARPQMDADHQIGTFLQVMEQATQHRTAQAA